MKALLAYLLIGNLVMMTAVFYVGEPPLSKAIVATALVQIGVGFWPPIALGLAFGPEPNRTAKSCRTWALPDEW